MGFRRFDEACGCAQTKKCWRAVLNVHVVESVREPQPDFAAMKRIIEGGGHKAADTKIANTERDVSRATELPAQSPLFWVEQKDRYLRQLLIRDIEEQSAMGVGSSPILPIDTPTLKSMRGTARTSQNYLAM